MLELREDLVPFWPFGSVSFFSSASKVLRHLCDHVLTRPEANFWSELLPSYREHLDPEDSDFLFYFARSLWSEHPPWSIIQVLYIEYSQAILEAMSDAIRENWYWAQEDEDGPSWRGLGLNGVYVIWNQRVVRTAMLLGYSAPPSESEPSDCRRTNPLPRQHAWKYRGARLRHEGHADYPPITTNRLKAHYHLFKKGAVRIRREYRHASREGRVCSGGAYLGSLRNGVPDYTQWEALFASHHRTAALCV